MKRRWGTSRLRTAAIVLLLSAAVGPARAASVSPEVLRIDSWTVLVMDHSYLFLRDAGTASPGLGILAGIRTEKEPELLRFQAWTGTDPVAAAEALAASGLLWDTDVEQVKELLAGQGFLASDGSGGFRDLTDGDLKVLEANPGTTVIGKDFIAGAVKTLWTGDDKSPVVAKTADCSFLSGALYFAEQSREAGTSTSQLSSTKETGASETLSSAILTQACIPVSWRPPGAPPYPSPAPPALPVPIPRPPVPVAPTPAVWANDPCSDNDLNSTRLCVNGSWQTCVCTCTYSGGGGPTWRQSASTCTNQTPAAPATPCSPAGGYGPCTAPGGVCICTGGPPPTWAPPPPPPPTPPPTTPPSTGSGEIAAVFAGLTLLATVWIVRRRARA